MPQIDGNKPTDVSVIAISTKATNGKEAVSFTSDNYRYDEETGLLEITVENQMQDGIVAWQKDAEDEYHINYVYDKTTQNLNLKQKAQVKMQTYGEEKEYTQESELTNNTNEKIGTVISNSIEFVNKEIGKGYLYEYNNNKAKYEVKLNQEIDYLELLGEGLKIYPAIDKIKNQAEEETDISGKTKITQIKISKANFEKILGQDGKIDILKDGSIIETINKETKIENENYVIELNENSNEITLQTTKPKENIM